MSDQWDAVSTQACVNGVDDEDVDHYSIENAGLSVHSDFSPLEYDLLGTPDKVQSVYFCGDEDMNPESPADDNDSVDNLSTTVMPKTSTSPESANDHPSYPSSLRSFFLDEDEEFEGKDLDMPSPIHDQTSESTVSDSCLKNSQNAYNAEEETQMADTSYAECSTRAYVPTPMANFAPLTYQNYAEQSLVQECEYSNDSDSTVAYSAMNSGLSDMAPDIHPQDTSDVRNSQGSPHLTTEQQGCTQSTLKRLRDEDEMEEQEHLAKRAVENASFLSSGEAGSSSNPYMNDRFALQIAVNHPSAASSFSPLLTHPNSQDPQFDNHFSGHFESNEVLDAALRMTGDSGHHLEEECKNEVADVNSDVSARPPRPQRCQRSRRLPARYRDGDYVCLLNDEGGDENASSKQKENFNSTTQLSAISPCANNDRGSDGSEELQVEDRCAVGYKDLSSSHFNFAGTRWNKVFASLRPVYPSHPKDAQRCGDCGCLCTSLETARRHVLSHVRLVRFACKLCGVGAFFATDLRTHLMKGLCTRLYSAPPGSVPVTSAIQANSLCKVADEDNPGGVILFDGEDQIVSSENINVHKPDANIEAKILERCT